MADTGAIEIAIIIISISIIKTGTVLNKQSVIIYLFSNTEHCINISI